MRRFLAIISAIVLAFLVTGGILVWNGAELSRDGLIGLFQAESDEETTPSIPKPVVPEEVNLSYDQLIAKGDQYFEGGFLTMASNEYVRAANLEPERAEPYAKLLKTHFELRNYKKALSNAEMVLKLQPSDLETKFSLVLIHIKLSEFETARTLLETYPMMPPDARVLYYKGLLGALYGEHDTAAKYLKEAQVAALDSALSGKITTILEAYQEFNYTQAAEPLYLSELLARGFNKVTEYEMAIQLLKEVLKERSDLRDGWILLGFAYLNLEKYQFALTAFEKAYSLDSEWPTTQYFLGIAHKELGHFEDAIVYFKLALSNGFEPQLVVHRHLADLYFETKDYANSAAAYEKVLEISQDDVNSFVRPVWLYLDYIKEPKKALKLAETAALAFPESAMSYNLLGWSHTALGEADKAESNLLKAIQMDPNLAAAYYNLGNLYKSQNRDEKALEAFQKAYQLDANGSIGNLAAQAHNELLKQTLSQ